MIQFPEGPVQDTNVPGLVSSLGFLGDPRVNSVTLILIILGFHRFQTGNYSQATYMDTVSPLMSLQAWAVQNLSPER